MARLKRLVAGLAADIGKLTRALPSQSPAGNAAQGGSGRKDCRERWLGGGGGGGGGIRSLAKCT